MERFKFPVRYGPCRLAYAVSCDVFWQLLTNILGQHVGPILKGQAVFLTWLTLKALTPNDPYSGRTAPLTSKLCILHIYSTNIGTEYFKHGINFPFFPLQNAVCFIILTFLVPVLFTFYIQGVLKLKKNNSGVKMLNMGPIYGSETSTNNCQT